MSIVRIKKGGKRFEVGRAELGGDGDEAGDWEPLTTGAVSVLLSISKWWPSLTSIGSEMQ